MRRHSCQSATLLGVSVCAFMMAAPLAAQSGRASLHGWVAFEDVAWVDPQPRAVVELRRDPPDTDVVYVTKTDERGFFDRCVHIL